MNTAELKLDLINRISEIADRVKLDEILQLLKFQNDEAPYQLSYEEKKAIEEAQQQVAEGRVVYDSDIQKEINEWLNKSSGQ